jgi:hypothetical protein
MSEQSINMENLTIQDTGSRHKKLELKNEEITRGIFQRLLGVKFTKIRSIFFNRRLELDGYCDTCGPNRDIKIGFEYQGRQHYEYVPYFHGTDPVAGKELLRKQQERDRIKRDECKEQGIHLIQVPFYINNKENYIKLELDTFFRSRGIDYWEHKEVIDDEEEIITSIDDAKRIISELKAKVVLLTDQLAEKEMLMNTENIKCNTLINKVDTSAMGVLDLSEEKVSNVISLIKFEDIKCAADGMVNFLKKHLLTDDQGRLNYVCLNIRDKIFVYKTAKGNIQKDVKCHYLFDAIYEPLRTRYSKLIAEQTMKEITSEKTYKPEEYALLSVKKIWSGHERFKDLFVSSLVKMTVQKVL